MILGDAETYPLTKHFTIFFTKLSFQFGGGKLVIKILALQSDSLQLLSTMHSD